MSDKGGGLQIGVVSTPLMRGVRVYYLTMQHYLATAELDPRREDSRVSYFRQKSYSPLAHPTPPKQPPSNYSKINDAHNRRP